MRYLGIDLGRATIGLALADDVLRTATPLHTIRRSSDASDLTELRRVVEEYEVETVVVQMPGVTGVCVYGVPDPRWGEAVKAVVEIAGGARPTAQQVSDFVGDRIARFKRPQVVVFTEALPRGADGSVDRDAVKARWGDA